MILKVTKLLECGCSSGHVVPCRSFIPRLFPNVGESMVRVLRNLGLEVDFLEDQTCCGQPAFNSGYQDEAKELAARFLDIFDQGDNIVCPSGSCVTMVKIFYKELFKYDQHMMTQLKRVISKTYEFSEFIVNVLGVTDVGASYNGIVTYHDSCHLLRELGISEEPRELIKSVRGIEYREMELHDACCGFGGAFSIKFSEVSVSMLNEKIDCILKSGANTVVANDMGCLMNIGGAISKRNLPIRILHIAELLAN